MQGLLALQGSLRPRKWLALIQPPLFLRCLMCPILTQQFIWQMRKPRLSKMKGVMIQAGMHSSREQEWERKP